MRTSIIRYALVGILLLGLVIPGVTLAGDGGKGCSNIGTWFGVVGPGHVPSRAIQGCPFESSLMP